MKHRDNVASLQIGHFPPVVRRTMDKEMINKGTGLI